MTINSVVVEIAGTVDSEVVAVTVGDVDATLANRRFVASVTVSGSAQQIPIVVRRSDGRRASRSVIIRSSDLGGAG